MTAAPTPWRRRLRRHRRWASALLLALAAATAVRAAVPERADGLLVTAGRDLPAGHVVEAADLAAVPAPRSALPDGALAADQLVGARLASPVRAGEALTDVRVVGPGLVATLPPGQAAVPVQLPAQVRPWLAVGQRLRLHAAADAGALGDGLGRPPDAVSATATVLDVAPDDAGGLLVGDGGGGVAALVQVDQDDAAALAAGGPVAAVLLGGS